MAKAKSKKQLTKLYVVEVRWEKPTSRRVGLGEMIHEGGYWKIMSSGELRISTNKLNAVRVGRQIAKAHQPSSLVIYNKKQKHQSERTYPRSRDPRRSKG